MHRISFDFGPKLPQIAPAPSSSSSNADKYRVSASQATDVKTLSSSPVHLPLVVQRTSLVASSATASTSLLLPKLPALSKTSGPSRQTVTPALVGQRLRSTAQPLKQMSAAQFANSYFEALYSCSPLDKLLLDRASDYLNAVQPAQADALEPFSELSAEIFCDRIEALKQSWACAEAEEGPARASILQCAVMAYLNIKTPTFLEFERLLRIYVDLQPLNKLNLQAAEAQIVWGALARGLQSHLATYDKDVLPLWFNWLCAIPGFAAPSAFSHSQKAPQLMMQVFRTLQQSNRLKEIPFDTTWQIIDRIFFRSNERAKAFLADQIICFIVAGYAPLSVSYLKGVVGWFVGVYGAPAIKLSGFAHLVIAEAVGVALSAPNPSIDVQFFRQYIQKMVLFSETREIEESSPESLIKGSYLDDPAQVSCLIMRGLEPILPFVIQLMDQETLYHFVDWLNNLFVEMRISSNQQVSYSSASPIAEALYLHKLYAACSHLKPEAKGVVKLLLVKLLNFILQKPELLKGSSFDVYLSVLALAHDNGLSLTDSKQLHKEILPTLTFEMKSDVSVGKLADFLALLYIDKQQRVELSNGQMEAVLLLLANKLQAELVTNAELKRFFGLLAPLVKERQEGVVVELERGERRTFYGIDNFLPILDQLATDRPLVHIFHTQTLVYLIRTAAIAEAQRQPIDKLRLKQWIEVTTLVINNYARLSAQDQEMISALQQIATELGRSIDS